MALAASYAHPDPEWPLEGVLQPSQLIATTYRWLSLGRVAQDGLIRQQIAELTLVQRRTIEAPVGAALRERATRLDALAGISAPRAGAGPARA